MKSTTATKIEDVKVEWHKLDAKDRVLGQIATEIVRLLQGKHKVSYAPYLNSGDKVVVINAKEVVLTGTKELNKLYHSHSQYIGNLKTYTAEQLRESDATKLIREAVKGMLPKNRLRDVRLANLYIYNAGEHPHTAQLKDK